MTGWSDLPLELHARILEFSLGLDRMLYNHILSAKWSLELYKPLEGDEEDSMSETVSEVSFRGLMDQICEERSFPKLPEYALAKIVWASVNDNFTSCYDGPALIDRRSGDRVQHYFEDRPDKYEGGVMTAICSTSGPQDGWLRYLFRVGQWENSNAALTAHKLSQVSRCFDAAVPFAVDQYRAGLEAENEALLRKGPDPVNGIHIDKISAITTTYFEMSKQTPMHNHNREDVARYALNAAEIRHLIGFMFKREQASSQAAGEEAT